MRVCPFHGCARPIRADLFACARHWRTLSPAEQREIHRAHQDYLDDHIPLAELRERQQAVLGDRGDVKAAGE